MVKGENRRPRDGGFTLAETIVVMSIMAMLAVAVTGVIVGSMSLITRMQVNTSVQAATQTVMETFQSEVRDAARIVSGDASSLVFDYHRGGVCERHQYIFETDPGRVGREQLRHRVAAVPLPDGVTCGDVAGLLTARVAGSVFETNRVELTNLGASNSGFTYQNVVGQPVVAPLPVGTCPGEPGREPRPDYVDVGSVLIVADTEKDAGSAGQVSVLDQVRAAVRSNTMGLSCR